jgi:cytochrome c oxidase cbb3-type subunit III
MPEPQDQLTDHNYDGIQEYDNPTPSWWTWIFVGTIVFSFFYSVVFILGDDRFGIHAQYQNEQTRVLMAMFSELGELEQDEPTLRRFITNPDDQKWLSAGAAIYRTNCLSCHGGSGEGISGTNLTDDYYLHIRTAGDIYNVINHGAANGAMPAWSSKLLPNEVVLVSAYVASLRGQNLPGRGPEGNVIPPFFAE